jgi:arginine/lysine/ornithine decarboxylase
MGKRPIVERMVQFCETKPVSFHVPGHKHGVLSELPRAFRDVMRFDYTELNGLDDYHHPEEVIEEAQLLLAKAYGAECSFFLVNGSTVGNLAMVYATCKEGDLVLVQRNAHKSIFHALQLVGANPVFLTPEWDGKTETPTYISEHTLKSAIELYPQAKALILTYPTYYGVTNPFMKDLIELAHISNMPVLVDEAHGAHFSANESFPTSSLDLGADIVVQSAHKTLPALTMGSYLHIQSNRVSTEKVNTYLRMLQTSSPSYLLLASLDDARDYLESFTQADANSFSRTRVQFLNGLQLIKNLNVIEVEDPLKLLLRVKGYTGFDLQRQLEEQGVYCELADTTQVLIIIPLFKRKHSFPFADIRMRIKTAVDQLKMQPSKKDPIDYTHDLEPISRLAKSYKEIDEYESEWIHYTKAMGRISAGMVIPYPPGIPLFIRGEKITTNKLEMLADYLASGATIQGEHDLNQKQLLVLKEETT